LSAPRSHRRLRKRPLGRYRYVRLRWRVLFTLIDFAGGLVFALARLSLSLWERVGVRANGLLCLRERPGVKANGPLCLRERPGVKANCSLSLWERVGVRAVYGLSRVYSNTPAADAKCPHPNPLPEGEGTGGPNPVPVGEGTGRPDPLPEGGGTGDPRVILLVQLDHMGDAVITSVMLPLLRRRYPHASIEVLAGAWNRELFEAMPEVDRVHVSRLTRFSRTGRFGWIVATLWWGLALRRREVDVAIDVRGELPLALILWLSGARCRVGWDAGGGGFLLTHSPRYVHGRPEVESRLALLAELGIRPAAEGRPTRPTLRPTEQGLSAESHLEGPPIVLHVGAGTEAKQWPAEHWRQLAWYLVVELGRQVVLVGGPDDRIIARRIAGPDAWPGLADWTGRLSVVELAALLERAELLVGGDSGPAHLAAAVGTPVVVLFSGTNRPQQWRPNGERVIVLREPVECSPCHRGRCGRAGHPCMRGLRPETVLAAIRRQLVPTVRVGKESDDDCALASARTAHE
jgi:lipopolysaccharide heptosyltransferase II